MTRRHPDSAHLAVSSTRPLHVTEAVPVTAVTPVVAMAASRPQVLQDAEFARELEKIRERLRSTESQLVDERNSRNELLKKVDSNHLYLFHIYCSHYNIYVLQ